MQIQVSADKLIALSRERSKDFIYFCNNHLRIRTVDATIVPFKLNRAQQYINSLVEEDIKAGRPVRMIVLKARQEGVSTYVEGRLFHFIHQNPNTTVMVVSHDEESSQHLFGISKTFFDYLPRWNKPTTKYSNRKEIYLERLGSKILNTHMFIESALSKNIGRSWTLHGLHISELAFWPSGYAKALLLGLLQAVPETPNTMVFIESTANGIGNEFYKRFWSAWRGESEYRAVFIPWFWEPRYSKPILHDDTCGFPTGGQCSCNAERNFAETLTDYELKLIEHHGLTLAQINWRRHKIATDFDGDIEWFNQEFPATPHEAFVSTSRTVFNKERLMEMMAAVVEPQWFNFDFSGRLIRARKNFANLRIWKMPRKGALYIIGADVSEGLDKGDFSCAQVIDVEKLELVASWHGRVDPDVFADELCKLGKLYNNALLVIEANNHGLTTLKVAANAGYPYIYMRRVEDTITGKITEKLGWLTTSKTKPLAIDALNRHIREGTIRIPCSDTLGECLTFVRDNAGRMSADGTAHDDRVMALAIAVKVWEEMPKQVATNRVYEDDVVLREEPLSVEQIIWRDIVQKRKVRHDILGELV